MEKLTQNKVNTFENTEIQSMFSKHIKIRIEKQESRKSQIF